MQESLVRAFVDLGHSVASAIPRFTVGILLFILSIMFAKLIEVSLRVVLIRVRFSSLIQRVRIPTALRKFGFRQDLEVFLPKLAFFLVIFLLAKTASDAFGLVAISTAIGAFFSYLPNVVAALLLLILGTNLGQFAGHMVTEAAQNSGVASAPLLGKLVSAVIIFVVAMMAMSQLKIDTEIVRILTSCVLAAGALAFGLAFGFGTRKLVQNIAAGFYIRRLLKMDKRLEIAGETGTLTAITATHTVLHNNEDVIIVANSAFLTMHSTQRRD
jgi:small-conductance mechanosensitive channel